MRSEEKYHEKREGGGGARWGKIKGRGSDKDEETDKQSKREKKTRGTDEKKEGVVFLFRREQKCE